MGKKIISLSEAKKKKRKLKQKNKIPKTLGICVSETIANKEQLI
jgi:hypothetical protein